jgi:hypothetical protein
MSKATRKQTREGRDRSFSAAWHAAVKAEATAMLKHCKERDTAAKARRAEVKAQQQRNER